MEFEFIDISALKQRNIQDEFDYIWSYCKKTGFTKYIQTKNDQDRLTQYVRHYGFDNVQQAIRKIHRRNLKFPLHILWQELQKLIVDKEELENIPAYRDAMTDRYNKKIKEELKEHEYKMMVSSYIDKKDNYKAFNNFEERDRSEGNVDGYMTYEEMESKLLGWE